MVNYLNDCSCNTGIIYGVAQCTSCGSNGCGKNGPCSAEITQKRIWNTVRVPASEYTMNIGALNVYTKPSAIFGNVNWNQMSDRPLPANALVKNIQTVPSHGNSTKRSLTRDRPGAQAPGGKGVDVKHGSYARYLARLKGKGPLKTQSDTTLKPIEGNKTKSYGIVASSNRVGSCLCFST
jgi:hypothetical protein